MAVNKVVYGSETLIDLTEDTVTSDTVADGYSVHLASGVRTTGTAKYAASPVANGNAVRTNGILYGEVDSTSTSKVFTATITGVTEYYDGLAVMLYNGVVTSASGFTININGLGAYGSYSNMSLGNDVTPTAATRDTTIFNINYAMLFVFSTNIGGVGTTGWICYRGYDANTNTIGYQLRTNSTVMTVTDTARYYKLYFTSANGKQWIPASVNSKNDATTARAVNQRPINPFGRIVYTSASTSYTSGSNLAATTIWDQYTLVLGYSFNVNGGDLTLTTKTPVYVKCAPQSDGSAIMDATTPIVQALPSTDDGKIYIYLGVAYDATHIELVQCHPVYYYKDGAVRLWTNASPGGVTSVNGQTGAVTLSIPTKTSDLNNDSGFLTTAVTSFNGSTGAVTYTAPVTSVNGATGAVTVSVPSGATVAPVMDGTAAIGSSAKFAKEDHVHPSDTAKVDHQSIDTNKGKTATITNSSGTITMTTTQGGNSVQGITINGLVTPSSNYMAATKKYVDDAVSAIPTLPSVTSSDNGKVLMVVSGAWAAASLPTYNGGVS